MKLIQLIITREYLNKIRTKSFIVMTFLSPILVMALFFFIFYIKSMNNPQNRNIAVVDESGYFSDTFKNTSDVHYYYWDTPLSQAKTEVVKKGYYGLIFIDKKKLSEIGDAIVFFSKETPSVAIVSGIKEQAENRIFNLNLAYNDIDIQQIEKSKVNIDLQLENFEGDKNSDLASLICFILGGLSAYFLMMFIVLYGNMIMRSVIEEKTNRIVEIIISSVKPFQLMMGKIIGTSLVGVTQFVVWLFLGGLLMFTLSQIFGVSPSSTNEILMTKTGADKMISEFLVEFFNFPIMSLVMLFLVYFIGGYLLYSSFYASIGAIVDSETDTQQFVFPIIMPLILSIYLGFAIVLDNPNGSMSVLFSMIPLTSPIVMLMRIPFGVPWWEVFISIIILYATFFLSIRLSAKIYRVGILMYGKKATYKELLKWIRKY